MLFVAEKVNGEEVSEQTISEYTSPNLIEADLKKHLRDTASEEYAAKVTQWWDVEGRDTFMMDGKAEFEIENGKNVDVWRAVA